MFRAYLKNNLLPLFLSLIILMIMVASFSSGQEVKAQLILKESVSDIQAHKKCNDLILPWVGQNCLSRIYGDKTKYCSEESCREEFKFLKQNIKDTSLLKFLFLGLLILTIFLFAELLKWIFAKGTKREYINDFFNRADRILDSIGSLHENHKKRSLTRELLYVSIFITAFLCFWGSFFLLAHHMK